MLSHQRAAAHTTTLARQPGSISGRTTLRAVDQKTTTPELPSAVPLMALSTGFWAFKTLAAAHELDLFSRLAGGAGITVEHSPIRHMLNLESVITYEGTETVHEEVVTRFVFVALLLAGATAITSLLWFQRLP
jgi:hypothetical protein